MTRTSSSYSSVVLYYKLFEFRTIALFTSSRQPTLACMHICMHGWLNVWVDVCVHGCVRESLRAWLRAHTGSESKVKVSFLTLCANATMHPVVHACGYVRSHPHMQIWNMHTICMTVWMEVYANCESSYVMHTKGFPEKNSGFGKIL